MKASSDFKPPSIFHSNRESASNAGSWDKSLHGATVPPPKSISFQKWADCQTARGRLDPYRIGFEDSYSSGKYTMSASGLALQFPGVILLYRGSKALLNSAAQWNPCQICISHFCNALNFSSSHELSLGSLERVGLWVPGDFSHSVVKQLFPEACYPHTHTRLKIAACPSLYSLCFQRHSLLSPAFLSLSFFFLVNKESGYSVQLATTYFQNTSTLVSNAIV